MRTMLIFDCIFLGCVVYELAPGIFYDDAFYLNPYRKYIIVLYLTKKSNQNNNVKFQWKKHTYYFVYTKLTFRGVVFIFKVALI